MDGPVTLMMQKTLLVRKEKAGNQDAKKTRTLRVVRAVRGRGGAVGVGVAVGCVFEIGGPVGWERGGRWGREGTERWRAAFRRWGMGRRGRRRVGMDVKSAIGAIVGSGEISNHIT